LAGRGVWELGSEKLEDRSRKKYADLRFSPYLKGIDQPLGGTGFGNLAAGNWKIEAEKPR